MKKLLLINPVGQRSGALLNRFSTFPPLSLAYVAAVTPSNWEVEIIDENFDTFNYTEADLVGITAFTSNINRAYELAALYRNKKTKVVIGGIHASSFIEEALQQADCVVAGEVEDIWGQVIADFEDSHLSSVYYGKAVDLSRFSVMPRRELFHPSYLWASVQTSRGCPFNCDFCSVSKQYGLNYRQRQVNAIVEEIGRIENKYITFVDDNLIGYGKDHRERSKLLFRQMMETGLKKKWWMQTSMNSVEDEEVIKLAANSGCMFALIGFESIKIDTLKQLKKGVNLKVGIDNYRRVVDTFHKYGIGVVGAFIIGNDNESIEYYKALADFLIRIGIDVIQITLLTPLPGTELMKRLFNENRVIYTNYPEDWAKYRMSYMVHHPKGIDIDTVYMGNNYLKNRIYSFPTYQYRMFKSFFRLKNITNFYAVYKFNRTNRMGWQNTHYYKRFPSDFRISAN